MPLFVIDRLAVVSMIGPMLLAGVLAISWTNATIAAPPSGRIRGDGEALVVSPASSRELAPSLRQKLPASLLPFEGPVSPATQAALAGRHDWDRFVSDSRLAPVVLTITPVTTAGSRVGHQVRAAFGLRTSLTDLDQDQEEAEPLGLGRAGGSYRLLTTAELAEAGIEPPGEQDERFALINLTLLHRVVVRGTIHIVRQRTDDGIMLVWEFDHRFDSQPDFRSTASRIESNQLGARVVGPAEPYAGGCGVVIARELPRDDSTTGPPVVVVESRLVIAEPESWFGGSNLLRAKIPLITQEGVRTLRRRLGAAAAP